jgi:methanethiol S-methyltransferase
MFNPFLVFVAMVAWSFLHSWLAALTTKKRVRGVFGEGLDRFYRLLYIGVALLTLIPILAMVVLLPSQLLWVIPTPWLYGTLFIQFLALIGLLITVRQIDVMSLIGLRQMTIPSAEKDGELVTSGTYGLVRHPLYLFSIILFWLLPYMTDLGLTFVIACTIYFFVGSVYEEQKMVAVFGDVYKQYQEDVPRIIPGENIKTLRL